MENRNNRAVEKRLKDCLKSDRARIQVGRISHFGLMEMSRQRIRASVLESTMQPCPHCTGTGLVRSDSSHALQSLRMIEEALLKDARTDLIVRLSPAKAMILLNKHRKSLFELEARFGVTINIESDVLLTEHAAHILRGGPATPVVPSDFLKGITPPAYIEDNDPDIIDVEEEEEISEADASGDDDEDEEGSDNSEARVIDGNGKKRRRKRKRGGNRDEVKTEGEAGATTGENPRGPKPDSRADGNDPKRKRRRGRRSGRRFRNDFDTRRYVPNAEPVGFTQDELDAFKAQDDEADAIEDAADAAEEAAENAVQAAVEVVEAPVVAIVEAPVVEATIAETPAIVAAEVVAEPAAEVAKPKRQRATAEAISAEPKVVTVVSSGTVPEETEQKPKSGWWKRGGFF
jgi:ribonuclease E